MTIWALVQWPVLVSLFMTYAARHPVRWLVFLAVAGELLTTLPLGVMTIIIFLPWVIRYFYRRRKIDFSIFFFLILFGTSFLQAVVLSLALVGKAWQQLPWFYVLTSFSFTPILVFCLLLFYDRQRNYF